jgi:hypothetical protein
MQIRPRISQEEYELIKQNRASGSKGNTSFKGDSESAEYTFETSERIKTLQDLIDACDIDLSTWDIERWICNKWEVGAKDSKKEIQVHPLFQVKIWLKPKSGKRNYFEIREELIEGMKSFAPIYPIIKRTKHEDRKLLIVDPADPHFGKKSTIEETGQDTNNISTAERFASGIEGLINKTDCYKFEKIVLVGGNDSMHTDNPFGTTTSGTRQDTCGLWYENFIAAKNANIQAIDRLLTIADVHFVFCPSNHDFMTGFFLADTIQSWYANNKNITFDVTPIHRKYIHYGHSLLGLTHGDGAKESELSDLMKTEAKKAWSLSRFAYWIVHHRHHSDTKGYKNGKGVKMEKDYKNLTVFNTGLSLDPTDYCFVQYMRSLSGTDRWHFTNGFVHAPKAMDALIIDPAYGQIDKITHLF